MLENDRNNMEGLGLNTMRWILDTRLIGDVVRV